jgi:hypothetical protein
MLLEFSRQGCHFLAAQLLFWQRCFVAAVAHPAVHYKSRRERKLHSHPPTNLQGQSWLNTFRELPLLHN